MPVWTLQNVKILTEILVLKGRFRRHPAKGEIADDVWALSRRRNRGFGQRSALGRVQGEGSEAPAPPPAVRAAGPTKEWHGVRTQPANPTGLCSEIQGLESMKTHTGTSWSTFRLPHAGDSIQTFTRGEQA